MVEIVRSLSLAYVPIRKVGTTSIRKAFRSLAEGPGDHVATYDRPMSAYVRFRARGCRTFVVVRDPVERFLSAYANRIHHHDDIATSTVDRAIARVLGLSLRPDIEEFCARFRLYTLSNDKLRRHFRLQSAYLGDNLGWFDHVYPLAETSRLAADLSNWSGRPVTFERLQTDGPKLRFADIPLAAQRRILQITEPDYRLLSGYFTRPDPS
jgi:hypothetical protein